MVRKAFFSLFSSAQEKANMPVLSLRCHIVFPIASYVWKKPWSTKSHTLHFSKSYLKQEVTWDAAATSISCGIDLQCTQVQNK